MGLFHRIFGKPEAVERRSSGSGFTAEIFAARASYIAGRCGLGELTGTVQTCISLWESGFALARVEGTDLLDRRNMALAARGLALRGEVVFMIRDDGLVPVADWDLSARDGRPRHDWMMLPSLRWLLGHLAAGGARAGGHAPELGPGDADAAEGGRATLGRPPHSAGTR